MKNGVRRERKNGTLAPSVKANNEARIGNIAANSSPRMSPFMLLRFETDHVGRFHFTSRSAAIEQFTKSSGRRHLVDHQLHMTSKRA